MRRCRPLRRQRPQQRRSARFFRTEGGRIDFQAVSLPPHLSSEAALKAPEMFRNAHYGAYSRAWQDYLESCNVNTSKFGTGGTKTMSWLFQA